MKAVKTFQPEAIHRLVELHRSIRLEKILPKPIQGLLVAHPTTKRQLTESYIPFVGSAYEPSGLLIYGMAQSLAKLALPSRRREFEIGVGLDGDRDPIFRLYRNSAGQVSRGLSPDETDYRLIEIQPFKDGVLPALAHVALSAMAADVGADPSRVTSRISVCNFFRHSLWKNGRDLNPKNSGAWLAYRSAVLETIIRSEVEILQPRRIIAFRGLFDSDSFEGVPVTTISDPSWILRGMGGAASRETGSWWREARKSEIDCTAYEGWLHGAYAAKAAAVAVYLRRYDADWRAQWKIVGVKDSSAASDLCKACAQWAFARWRGWCSAGTESWRDKPNLPDVPMLAGDRCPRCGGTEGLPTSTVYYSNVHGPYNTGLPDYFKLIIDSSATARSRARWGNPYCDSRVPARIPLDKLEEAMNKSKYR